VLGSQTGTSYRVGTVLNRYSREGGLRARARVKPGIRRRRGCATAGAVRLRPCRQLNDTAIKSDGIVALAALESQYCFVIVPNDIPCTNSATCGPGEPGHSGPRAADARRREC
jgi:hypothetical protein